MKIRLELGKVQLENTGLPVEGNTIWPLQETLDVLQVADSECEAQDYQDCSAASTTTKMTLLKTNSLITKLRYWLRLGRNGRH